MKKILNDKSYYDLGLSENPDELTLPALQVQGEAKFENGRMTITKNEDNTTIVNGTNTSIKTHFEEAASTGAGWSNFIPLKLDYSNFGEDTTNLLTVGTTEITSDLKLKVSNTTETNDLKVNGTANVNNLTVNGTTTFNSPVNFSQGIQHLVIPIGKPANPVNGEIWIE